VVVVVVGEGSSTDWMGPFDPLRVQSDRLRVHGAGRREGLELEDKGVKGKTISQGTNLRGSGITT
jgi:hypothetical protein